MIQEWIEVVRLTFNKATIYYTSGTGNSYRVALWVAKAAKEKGIDTKLVKLEEAVPMEEVEEGGDSLMGIVMPTHGFTAPWHLLKFVWRIPRRKETRAFCITTRGGSKFGPVFVSGIGGSATFIVALILALKGFRIPGVLGIDMPSNWMSLHPGLHPKNAGAIINRAKHRTFDFSTRILLRENCWINTVNISDFVLGLLLLPVSLGYLWVGRYFLAKLVFCQS